MKNFETIEHTADVGGRIYGKDIEELFVNAVKLLYFLAGVKQYQEKTKVIKIEIKGQTIEELLVKFLNELIYYMDSKMVGGDIKNLFIEKANEGFNLYCEVDGHRISMVREIKAATYHNIRIKEKNGFFSSEIIFDI
ncbi:MAG: archease [bacterium]|nr:archease [bacterium]